MVKTIRIMLVVMQVLLIMAVVGLIGSLIAHSIFEMSWLIIVAKISAISLGAIFIISTILAYIDMSLTVGIVNDRRYYLEIKDNNVALKYKEIRRVLFPVPYKIFEEITTGGVVIEEFYQIILRDAKRVIIRASLDQICKSLKKYFLRIGEVASANINTQIDQVIDDEVQCSPRKTRRAKPVESQAAEMLLRKSLEESLGAFKQDILALASEKIKKSLTGVGNKIFGDFNSNAGENFRDVLRNPDTHAIPEGTKFWLSNGFNTVAIIEQPAQARMVHFEDEFFTDAREKLSIKAAHAAIKGRDMYLSFPYVIFLITFAGGLLRKVRVYYSNKPISSLDDQLFLPNLPNIYTDCKFCMPSQSFPLHSSTTGGQAKEMIGIFWQSEFNHHEFEIHYDPSRKLDRRLFNVWQWERSTKKNPLFALEVNWRPADTLRNILTRLSQEYGSSDIDRLQYTIEQAMVDNTDAIVNDLLVELEKIKVGKYAAMTTKSELDEYIRQLAQKSGQLVKEKLARLQQNNNKGIRNIISESVKQAAKTVLEEEHLEIENAVELPTSLTSINMISRVEDAIYRRGRR